MFMTEKIEMEKVILDCGAGGGRPPLGLFAEWGYKCYGIDISEQAINAARQFATKHNLKIDLRIGDFRHIPFNDESFSFVFTQNSLNHLSKIDTEIAIAEMKRVLKPGGLLFVDFMSVDCSYCNEEEMGKLVGDYEFFGVHGEGESLHSFFRNDEPDRYFDDMEAVRKKKVVSTNFYNGRTSTDVLLWYYLRKPSK